MTTKLTESILIIEDNQDLAFGLQTNLEFQGYQVQVSKDGRAGLKSALANPPDLVILDLMLPGLDGINVLKQLRAAKSLVPVLILSAKGNELDKVLGLRSGSDDYVTKPFGLMELMARVEALLRRSRSQGPASDHRILIGDIQIDTEAKEVCKNGRKVALTPKEYGLLLALARQNGAATSRYDLMAQVWGYSSAVVSRTVDTHIAELRRKLEDDPSRPRHIVTVRKFGYRLDW